MEKVKVSKKIDVALKYIKESPDSIIPGLLNKFAISKFHTDKLVPLNELSFRDFYNALHYGWEYEETKEERLLNFYLNIYSVNSKNIIEDVLDILEIKIEGINKEG